MAVRGKDAGLGFVARVPSAAELIGSCLHHWWPLRVLSDMPVILPPSLPVYLVFHFFIFFIVFLLTFYNLFAQMLMFLLLRVFEYFLKVSNIYIPSASSLGGSSIPASGL